MVCAFVSITEHYGIIWAPSLQLPDDGKERERETVTVGEAAKIAAAAACGFCKIGC